MLQIRGPPRLFIQTLKMAEAEFSSVTESSNVEEILPEESNTAVSSTVKLPQKRFFRQRAHANPFSDHLLE